MATGDGTFHRVIDIQGKFRAMTFSETSAVTVTEITEEITRTESYVMGKIEPFYDVSAIDATDTPRAFSIVREICTLFTSGKVNEILRKNGMQPQSSDENNRTDNLISRANGMLKGIQLFVTVGNVDGAISLYDISPRALPTTNVSTGQGTSKPIFNKDIDQW